MAGTGGMGAIGVGRKPKMTDDGNGAAQELELKRWLNDGSSDT